MGEGSNRWLAGWLRGSRERGATGGWLAGYVGSRERGATGGWLAGYGGSRERGATGGWLAGYGDLGRGEQQVAGWLVTGI